MVLLPTVDTASEPISQIKPGMGGSSGVYSKAAVATDADLCSGVGVSILKKGGSAVDAAIAGILCTGVVNLHSSGIGGGGFMIYYEAATQRAYTVDFREVAPLAASHNMYDGLEPTASIVGEFSCMCHPFSACVTIQPSALGGLSVAVPSELRGLEMAWKRWGRLKWQELFQPAINLSRNGFPVSPDIKRAIGYKKGYLTTGKFPGL